MWMSSRLAAANQASDSATVGVSSTRLASAPFLLFPATRVRACALNESMTLSPQLSWRWRSVKNNPRS
ncbi:hypothetical protein ACFFX0_25975 [Citricoccus parietis]|uniref:Uncharacterized protein n=1 Tax=Citricoccus parietis TaxID=592307 RepID=A0ABV5G6A4_9MICC